MGRLLAALALTCLIACESKVAPPAAPKEPVTNAQAKPAAAPAAPPLYDGAGNLLPSGEHVAWLELPRGLKVTPMALAEHHAF